VHRFTVVTNHNVALITTQNQDLIDKKVSFISYTSLQLQKNKNPTTIYLSLIYVFCKSKILKSHLKYTLIFNFGAQK